MLMYVDLLTRGSEFYLSFNYGAHLMWYSILNDIVFLRLFVIEFFGVSS